MDYADKWKILHYIEEKLGNDPMTPMILINLDNRFEQIRNRQCPVCLKKFKIEFKHEKSKDKETRERFLSGTCSLACWTSLSKKFPDLF